MRLHIRFQLGNLPREVGRLAEDRLNIRRRHDPPRLRGLWSRSRLAASDHSLLPSRPSESNSRRRQVWRRPHRLCVPLFGLFRLADLSNRSPTITNWADRAGSAAFALATRLFNPTGGASILPGGGGGMSGPVGNIPGIGIGVRNIPGPMTNTGP